MSVYREGSWKGKQRERNDGPPYAPTHTATPSLNSSTTNHSQSNKRGSIIFAASDALTTLKLRRRSKSVRHPSAVKNAPIVLPEVIEISAARIAEEDNQERLRLREAAAQSLGLGPVLSHTSHDSDYGPFDDHQGSRTDITYMAQSNISLVSPQSTTSRKNSGTILSPSHSRTGSTSTYPIPVPSFPSNPAELSPYVQKSSILPKLYPPASIRIFSLNKQWKLRHIILTSPPSCRASYLHLFKFTKKGNDQSSKELELERLEINEDSVVFVAEEAGRKGVIKIGGKDVGALKRELNGTDEFGRTMWALQVADQREAQNWIETVKSCILQLRSMKAGLGSVTQNLGSIEPKGDMDVVLSMRAQSLYVPPSSPTAMTNFPIAATGPQDVWRPQTSVSVNSISSSSSYSHHTSTNGHSPTTTPSRALKGLFGNRSRSPSGASLSDPNPADRAQADNSFGFMGNSLINMMRPGNGSTSTFTNPSTPSIPNPGLSGHATGVVVSPPILDRKIVSGNRFLGTDESTPDSSSWTRPTTARSAEKVSRTLSLQIPLQPPPRKRWTSIGPGNPQERISEDELLAKPNPSFQQGMYRNAGGNGSLSAVGIVPGGDFAGSDRASVLSTPRAPSVQSVSVSLQSVSTLASAERVSPVGGSGGRPSVDTKRSSRRWSRQGSLPKRTTPPAGPPPAAPGQVSTSSPPATNNRTSLDNHSHGRSSVHSTTSEKSGISGFPSFGRQNTHPAGSPQQQGQPIGSLLHPNTASSHGRATSSHRTSMPPPRGPAPTIALPLAPHEPRGSRRDSEPPLPLKAPAFASPPSNTISRLRDRTFRISLMEPKPPPSSELPPRPDEVASGSSELPISRHLPPIPASPVPPPLLSESIPDTKKPVPVPSRNTSLRRRLRILSAPASAPTTPLLSALSVAASNPLRNSLQLQRNNSFSSSSRPETPVGEHIAHPKVQNDPRFIDGTVLPTPSPTISYFPLIDVSSGIRMSSRSRPADIPSHVIDDYPDFISLSPPPRRTSKQLSQMEIEQMAAAARGIDSPAAGIARPPSILDLGASSFPASPVEKDNVLTASLTRRGSVVSVGIVTM